MNAELIDLLETKVGRLLFNQFPMEWKFVEPLLGGPYPDNRWAINIRRGKCDLSIRSSCLLPRFPNQYLR